MSRYINADELLEQIRKKLGIKSLDYLLEAERQIVDVIQSAPSIDIVFCRECKYLEVHGKTTKYYWCDQWEHYTDEHLFCANAERKADE